MVRVVLGSSSFDTFVPSNFTDSYVKLVFVDDDVDVAGLPQPLTLDSFADLPPEKKPVGADHDGPRRRRQRPARSRWTSWCTVSTGRGHLGGDGPTRPAHLSDGPRRRVRPRPGRRLASAGRRRIGAAGHRHGAGSVAAQRNRQGVHRGGRPGRRDPADRTGFRRGELGLSRRPRRSGARGPRRRFRAADRGGHHRRVAAGAGARLHPRRSANRHAQPAAVHPQRARRGCQVGVVDLRVTGAAAAPKRRSGSGRKNWPRRRQGLSRAVAPGWHSLPHGIRRLSRTRSTCRAWPESCRRCRWSSRSWRPRPRWRCRRRCGPTSPAVPATSAPSGPTARPSSAGA